MLMLDRVRECADDFDILHFHIDQFHFPLFRPLCRPHADDAARPAGSAGSAAALFRLQRDAAGLDLRRVSARRSRTPISSPRSTMGCRVDLHRRRSIRAAAIWPFSAAFRRRRASIARSRWRSTLGMPLKIAAKVDRVDEAYFREQIAPLLEDAGRRIHRRNQRAGEDRLSWPGFGADVPDRLARAVRPVDD